MSKETEPHDYICFFDKVTITYVPGHYKTDLTTNEILMPYDVHIRSQNCSCDIFLVYLPTDMVCSNKFAITYMPICVHKIAHARYIFVCLAIDMVFSK
jgi:hypothetical protein